MTLPRKKNQMLTFFEILFNLILNKLIKGEKNMSFDKKNYDSEAAKAARKTELDEISVKLENGVKDVFNGKNFKDYLDFCARLPKYSLNNQILIMLQCPNATMVQSFTGWKAIGRSVKKGEKGIRILAPAPFKVERERDKKDEFGHIILKKDGTPEKEKVSVTINAFKAVSTFDVSQTEGEPIPELEGAEELKGDVEDYLIIMEAVKDIIPVPVSFIDIDTGAKGYFDLENKRIAVKKGMSEVQTLKTLIHEFAHERLHSKKDDGEIKSKNQQETEAESIAYVVCAHFGIDTSDYSFSYLASWSTGKEVTELKKSLDTIRKTASDIIDEIEGKLSIKKAA